MFPWTECLSLAYLQHQCIQLCICNISSQDNMTYSYSKYLWAEFVLLIISINFNLLWFFSFLDIWDQHSLFTTQFSFILNSLIFCSADFFFAFLYFSLSLFLFSFCLIKELINNPFSFEHPFFSLSCWWQIRYTKYRTRHDTYFLVINSFTQKTFFEI